MVRKSSPYDEPPTQAEKVFRDRYAREHKSRLEDKRLAETCPISVKLDTCAITAPKLLLYHGTSSIYEKQITRCGLDVGSWITNSQPVAIAFAKIKAEMVGGNPIVYELHLEMLQREFDRRSEWIGATWPAIDKDSKAIRLWKDQGVLKSDKICDLQVVWRGDPISTLKLTPEAQELLSSHIGYRTENAYGEGYREAKAVLDHEINELGNEGAQDEAAQALGLPENATEKQIYAEIDRRFGTDAKVLWLATKEGVKYYLEADTDDDGEPDAVSEDAERSVDEYKIPAGAIVLNDLGSEGQLFLMTNADYEKMAH